jgi:hypothetical protein
MATFLNYLLIGLFSVPVFMIVAAGAMGMWDAMFPGHANAKGARETQ